MPGVGRVADQGQRLERGDNVCSDWKSLDAPRSSIDQGGRVLVAFLTLDKLVWHYESTTINSHLVYRFKLPLASVVVLLISAIPGEIPSSLKQLGRSHCLGYVREGAIVSTLRSVRQIEEQGEGLEKVGKSVWTSTATQHWRAREIIDH